MPGDATSVTAQAPATRPARDHERVARGELAEKLADLVRSRDLDQAPQRLRGQVWIPVLLDCRAQRGDRRGGVELAEYPRRDDSAVSVRVSQRPDQALLEAERLRELDLMAAPLAGPARASVGGVAVKAPVHPLSADLLASRPPPERPRTPPAPASPWSAESRAARRPARHPSAHSLPRCPPCG